MTRASFIPGATVGLVTVIAEAGRSQHRETLWRCICACGRETIAKGNRLRTARKKSCGCLYQRRGAEDPRADTRPVLDRLAERSYTVLATGCTVFAGRSKKGPYGTICIAGKVTVAHRAAWEATRGPIPPGLDCLHNCPGGDNPACWNVDHLWLGTQADNNADRDRKGRRVTPRGEEHANAKLTEEAVLAIRADRRPLADVATEHGVSLATISEVRNRKRWVHV